MNISEINHTLNDMTTQVSKSVGELLGIRTTAFGIVESISLNHTIAKVRLSDTGKSIYAAIIQHPNYWNIVGHLRVGDMVLCSIQKKNFDVHILFRIHDKSKDISEYVCYKNNDTNPWGTMAA